MNAEHVAAALEATIASARKLDPKRMRALDRHPQAKEKFRRHLAAHGLSADDIKHILSGTLPDSALPGLFGSNPPQN